MNSLIQYIQPPSGAAAATAATPIISNKLARLMRDKSFLEWLSQQELGDRQEQSRVNELQSKLPEPIGRYGR